MYISEYIEDSHGDLIDIVYVCSDSCHRDYCNRLNIPYLGWDGCHEECEINKYCDQCGVRISTDIDSDCSGVCLPVVVNLICADPTHICEHGVRNEVMPEWRE